MLARQPVSKAIEKADDPIKSQLELSQSLLVFAVQKLGLPESTSYHSYVALEREFPVWNVIAAPEFSLNAKQWCYPVIGCASYRGYFDKNAAHHYANKLKAKGFDTMVGGVSAYSTLGWFADPLLPSMLRYGSINFAETLFHELAHQQLYVNGDSDFNEAFATVVGEVGARRWLEHQAAAAKVQAYQARLAAREQFHVLIGATKSELELSYAKDFSDSEKRIAKRKIIKNLNKTYADLKKNEWGGKPFFDGWFEDDINNARLASFSTYREKVPALQALLKNCNDDLKRFYQVLSHAKVHDGRVQIPIKCI